LKQLIGLILVLFCINNSAQDQPLTLLVHSGKIDLPLMEKVKSQRLNLDQVAFDVLIVFDADSSIARHERSLVELNQVNTRRANEILQRQVAGGGFYLRRQFQSINALAATVSIQGLSNLVQDNRVVKVGLDVGGSGGLAEAIPQISVDKVRRIYGLTGTGIEVAVLDTGIDVDHQDLQSVLLSQKCFADVCPNGGDNAEDDNGHGTHVTGIIASLGIDSESGIAPGVGIHAVKVLDADNSYSSASIILAGLDYIINELPSVNIVNMSLGTRDLFPSDCDTDYAYTAAFSSAINTLRNRGTLSFVASMNNASENAIAAPACIANAIAVGAVWDANPSSYFGSCTDVSPTADEMTCFSNTSVSLDMLAPGSPIRSLRNGGGTITYSGTSMATPMVAACAALMLEKDPSSMPNRIESLLKKKTSVFVDDAMNRQFPRIDCFQAIQAMTATNEPAGILDIDVNGQFDALTDGLLLLRSMFGIEGNPLILNAVAPDAYYQSVSEISQQIASVIDETDIDGDGTIDALTDGILILRYLFGLEGQILVDGVVAPGATRTTEQIEEYLDNLVVKQ
jgi:subtilisin family serine protease